MGMKYLIVGSGGTGGCIGAFLVAQGKDVTFIARGAHLRMIRDQGLKVDSGLKGQLDIDGVKSYEAYEYEDKADIIFVCVKSYSLDSVISLIQKASHSGTIVIPVLNVFGTGEKLAKVMPQVQVLDGCIYIVAYVAGPGALVQRGNIFKLVYGPREGQIIDWMILNRLKEDLEECGIKAICSENIRKDTFQKFSFISSYAACGAYYDIEAQEMQKPGKIRELLRGLQNEVKLIGEAMGIYFEEDLPSLNMKVVDALAPETTASMQKDMRAGRESEIDGLVFEVVRLGQKLGVNTPYYEKVMDKLLPE